MRLSSPEHRSKIEALPYPDDIDYELLIYHLYQLELRQSRRPPRQSSDNVSDHKNDALYIPKHPN